MKTNTKTGGQWIAQAAVDAGIRAAFCVPGESYLGVLDGLYDHQGQIRVIGCRHEHGASHAAEAWGKLMGKPALCMVTRGPGAANAAIGVHTAFQDSTPMVVLVGHVAQAFEGREAFQEVDFEAMFAPLAKAVRKVTAAKDCAADVNWAVETATEGRPGPVVLVLPEDVLSGAATSETTAAKAPAGGEMKPGDGERLHRRLHDSERPVLLVGGSGWDEKARADLKVFVENFDLPVCCSFRRHDIFDNRHPNFIGELGIGPNPDLVKCIQNADTLLVAGARLGEMTSQGYTLLSPEDSMHKLVHVHVSPLEPGRVFPTELGVIASPGAFAASASKLSPPVDRWAAWRADARAAFEAWRTPADVPGPLQLGHIMAALDEHMAADAICTVDAGNFAGWAQRFVSFGGDRKLLGPTNGAMGYAVPAAVAAKVAQPQRQVVAFVGDGGFGMTGGEIATAMAEGVNPVIVLFNNASFGTIRMHQETQHPGRPIATDLVNPDFAALARSYGAFGEVVETTEQFMPAFEGALASARAAVIELRYDVNLITTRFTLDDLKAKAAK